MTDTPHQKQHADIQALLKAADQCVMCGMCLPACPTYQLRLNEAESPRGRISLIQALLRHKLELDATLSQHLDTCLTCRACEAICPSGVQYGRLIDGARIMQREAGKKPDWRMEKLLETTATPEKLRSAGKMLRLAQLSGADKLLRAGLSLAGKEDLWREVVPTKLPAYQPWQERYPAQGEKQGTVALFTGCIADLVDQQTLRDTITLLTRCGYEVSIPQAQTCCGALHTHAGDIERGRHLARQNLAAFDSNAVDAIVFAATGCGAHLIDYGRFQQDDARAGAFAAKTMDALSFLQKHGAGKLTFKPLPKRIAVHTPCTQRNVLKQAKLPFALLGNIPAAELIALPGNEVCCGAAGSYMLEHPQNAGALREKKLQALAEVRPDILVTSNIGCSLHLQAGLKQQGIELEIIHPLSLLARQLSS
ncbi:MAG: (Fe-S)-binding protein [Pseudomonadota bacterium]